MKNQTSQYSSYLIFAVLMSDRRDGREFDKEEIFDYNHHGVLED